MAAGITPMIATIASMMPPIIENTALIQSIELRTRRKGLWARSVTRSFCAPVSPKT
jgi:hypothetical protein